MGDTDERVIRLFQQPPCPPSDLKREARRLERLRAARAAAAAPAGFRPWPERDPDGPKQAA